VTLARQAAAVRQLDHLVTIQQGDLFDFDVTPATVVYLYMLPKALARLAPRLIDHITRTGVWARG